MNNLVVIMKKFLSILLAVLAGFIVIPQQAEARHSCEPEYVYVSGYTGCGCPIYTKRVVSRYDYYGRPIYSYYNLPVNHRCHQSCNTGVTIQIGNGIYYRNYQPSYHHSHRTYYPSRHQYHSGRSSHHREYYHRTCR